MAYRFTRPLALLITSLFMSHAAMANVTVGAPAPDFTATDALSGEAVTLSALKGKLVVLEFSKPGNPVIRGLYNFYNATALPLVGKLLSKDSSAYTYLPESVAAFPEGNAFVEFLTSAGFKKTKALPLTFGISSVYIGTK